MQHEIDVVVHEGETIADAMREMLAGTLVRYELVMERGKTGWPTVRLDGPESEIEEVLRAYDYPMPWEREAGIG